MVKPVLRTSRDAEGTYCVHFEIFNLSKKDADEAMQLLDSFINSLEMKE